VLTVQCEISDNLQAVGHAYKYALEQVGIPPTYTTTVQDPGILICPTRFPHTTLCVITSESSDSAKPSDVSFEDQLSKKPSREGFL
jgi:hypothetical protein